jgi:hypothetical protein
MIGGTGQLRRDFSDLADWYLCTLVELTFAKGGLDVLKRRCVGAVWYKRALQRRRRTGARAAAEHWPEVTARDRH